MEIKPIVPSGVNTGRRLTKELYKTENHKKAILVNSEDPNEMLHSAAFHLDLHCLLKQNRSSEKEMQYFFRN